MKKLLIITILTLSFTFCSLHFAFCEVPHLINYQGRLTDSEDKPLTDGIYNITFRIYDAVGGGNLLWQETQPVVTKSGIFSVLLGSTTDLDLPFDKSYWLEIKLGGEAMEPRQRIASVGYSLRAKIADTISDPALLVPRGAIIMWSGLISDIPEGWALCDGTNNTPDLRDKFIVGVRQDDGDIAKTNVKGRLLQAGGEHEHVLTIAEMPAHHHTHSRGWDCGGTSWYAGPGHILYGYTTANTSTVGDNQPHENCPPFYALAFIMKL